LQILQKNLKKILCSTRSCVLFSCAGDQGIRYGEVQGGASQ